MKSDCRHPCCVVSRTRERCAGCHLSQYKHVVYKSLATKCSSSNPRTALCLTQDIPRCTTFHCCSVILDRVPASSCQNAPINTHPTLKSSLRRGHSRSVSFWSLPPHSCTHTVHPDTLCCYPCPKNTRLPFAFKTATDQNHYTLS